MPEQIDQITHPLTQFLSGLTRAEQFKVLMTHPLFTGRCPQCEYHFPLVHPPLIEWNCNQCGWLDDSV